jgi:hypothetical protein
MPRTYAAHARFGRPELVVVLVAGFATAAECFSRTRFFATSTMLALEDRVVTGIWVLLHYSRNRGVNFVQASPLYFFQERGMILY